MECGQPSTSAMRASARCVSISIARSRLSPFWLKRTRRIRASRGKSLAMRQSPSPRPSPGGGAASARSLRLERQLAPLQTRDRADVGAIGCPSSRPSPRRVQGRGEGAQGARSSPGLHPQRLPRVPRGFPLPVLHGESARVRGSLRATCEGQPPPVGGIILRGGSAERNCAMDGPAAARPFTVRMRQ